MSQSRPTTFIRNELMSLDKDTDQFKRFMQANPADPNYDKLSDFLNAYLSAHPQLTIPLIVKRSGQDSGYVHQIFNGIKSKPSKYKLIAICIAMEMDIVSTRRALRIAQQPGLDEKNYVDMGIIICINNEDHDINKVEEFLEHANLESPFL